MLYWQWSDWGLWGLWGEHESDIRTRAAAHSSMQSPRSLVRQPSRPQSTLSPQPLYVRSESLFELGRRFLDLKYILPYAIASLCYSTYACISIRRTSLIQIELTFLLPYFKHDPFSRWRIKEFPILSRLIERNILDSSAKYMCVLKTDTSILDNRFSRESTHN